MKLSRTRPYSVAERWLTRFRPVVRERVRVITQPVPVIEQRVSYVEQEEPRYREHWNRGWHGHHHGHHDDDDD